MLGGTDVYSLVSQASEGKIRLVTNARFSFPVADFVTHQ